MEYGVGIGEEVYDLHGVLDDAGRHDILPVLLGLVVPHRDKIKSVTDESKTNQSSYAD